MYKIKTMDAPIDNDRSRLLLNSGCSLVVIAWRRGDLLSRLLERLKLFCSLPVYIYIDGDNDGMTYKEELDDTLDVAQRFAKEYIGETSIIMRSENLGCFYNVTEALDAVSRKHKCMVVLEEDCIPNSSFFEFCSYGLRRYEHDKRILQISGTRFINKAKPSMVTMSRFTHTWGWATWSDRWELYKKTLVLLEVPNYLGDLTIAALKPTSLKSLKKRLAPLLGKKKHTWDYQWLLTGLITDKFTVLPPSNTIENIGIGSTALHTKKMPAYLMPTLDEFNVSMLNEEDWSFNYDGLYTQQIFDIDFLSRLRIRLKING